MHFGAIPVPFVICNFFAGKPHKPKDLEVILETTISVSVRWKAGFNGGYGSQMFRLEYKKSAESGTFQFSLNYTMLSLKA